MFIETSSPQYPSESAFFLSTVFDATAGSCFTFWYHMYGDTIGELAFYIGNIDDKGRRTRDMGWYLAGPQSVDDRDWLYGQFGIVSSRQYQVSHEAVRKRCKFLINRMVLYYLLLYLLYIMWA